MALPGTVTVAGTVTAELLLARLKLMPPLGAVPFSDTVHESVPAPVMDEFVQESALSVATPVPLRLAVIVPPEEALLEIVSVPAAPEIVGSNCTCSVAVWFGVKVTGNEAPETVKPVPVIVAELIVSVPLPLEVNVTDCVVGVFKFTLPKETLLALRVSAGTEAFSCRANEVEALPKLAVSVAVSTEVTAETVAVKPTLVALAGTVAVAGTLTEELLLARLTVNPPLGAAPLSATVQESDPAPVIEELLHESELSVATPVPLKFTVAVPPEVALLAMVSVPVIAPEAVGSNCTCSVAV
ncbi:MAG: hypothetical protein WBE76_06425 [Terracidiphilus sp.]